MKFKRKKNIKKKKKKAVTEGSMIHEPLIPADPSQIMIAIIHILLGITISLWVLLIETVQSVDQYMFVSKHYFQKILEKLKVCVATSTTELETASNLVQNAEKQKMNYYEVYNSTQNCYSQNNAVTDEQQNQILNLLKRDWLDSLDILKRATTKPKVLKLQRK